MPINAEKYAAWCREARKIKEGDGKCLYPLPSGVCQLPVIRAHSVSKAFALKAIARDGHVYTTDVDPSELAKSNGAPEYSLVGIRRASTFTGFCGKHDNILFSEIDSLRSVPNFKQAFLFHYRALCRELYVKRAATNGFHKLLEHTSRDDVANSDAKNLFISLFKDGASAALDRLKREKDNCDAILEQGSFDKISTFVAVYNDIPQVLCSGLTQPTYDFCGRALQNLADDTQETSMLSVSIVPLDGFGVAAFSSASDPTQSNARLLNSFDALPYNLRSTAVVQLVFDAFENHFSSPKWWESLSDSDRNTLRERTLNWQSPFREIDKNALVTRHPMAGLSEIVDSYYLR